MKKSTLKKQDMPVTGDYMTFLNAIKTDILQTQMRAAIAITQELTMLYWRIGKMIDEKMKIEGWGTKVVDVLARDIKIAFPDLKGFSLRNLRYMRLFFETYPQFNFAAAAAKLPWWHNIVILEKLKNNDQRLWYAEQALQKGWSRDTLIENIESDLYRRQGGPVTNFSDKLPKPTSALAQETLKDPYNFSFLMFEDEAHELVVERGLVDHIEKFLLELGQGFSFVGRQQRIQVGNGEFYIDMLFYHLKLRCYIVIELKAKAFDARDVGQLNLYLTAVDRQLRHPGDNPSIGLLLCKSKDNVMAEYALQDVNKPIGVSSYYTSKIMESLPKDFEDTLPSIELIEAELEKSTAVVKEKTTKKRLKIDAKKKSSKSQKSVKK